MYKPEVPNLYTNEMRVHEDSIQPQPLPKHEFMYIHNIRINPKCVDPVVYLNLHKLQRCGSASDYGACMNKKGGMPSCLSLPRGVLDIFKTKVYPHSGPLQLQPQPPTQPHPYVEFMVAANDGATRVTQYEYEYETTHIPYPNPTPQVICMIVNPDKATAIGTRAVTNRDSPTEYLRCNNSSSYFKQFVDALGIEFPKRYYKESKTIPTDKLPPFYLQSNRTLLELVVGIEDTRGNILLIRSHDMKSYKYDWIEKENIDAEHCGWIKHMLFKGKIYDIINQSRAQPYAEHFDIMTGLISFEIQKQPNILNNSIHSPCSFYFQMSKTGYFVNLYVHQFKFPSQHNNSHFELDTCFMRFIKKDDNDQFNLFMIDDDESHHLNKLTYTFPPRPPQQVAGAADKIRILGRWRKVYKEGRKKYVVYMKQRITMTEARKLELKKSQKTV